MKKIYFNLTSFALAGISIAFAACTNEPAALIEKAESNAPIIYASQELQVKSSITVDGEGVGTIYWSPADDISIFYGASTPVLYTSTNLTPETTAAFTTSAIIGSTELASTNIWGLYPHNPSAVCDGSSISTTLPSTQYGVSGTFDDDLFMTVAHSDDTNLHFYNVCGGIKFSLSRDDITAITFSGNNSEDIAGDITVSFVEGLPSVSVDSGEKTITVTPKGGGTFASDTYYYIVVLPQTLSSGFTMTFETETQIGTFEYNAKAVTIKRSVFGKKDDIDGYAVFTSKPTPIVNLSSAGTANCYIVSAAGKYKFKAVQGNSDTSVEDIKGVKVLWETFGTSSAPSMGDLIKPDVSFVDGFIIFSTNDSYQKGNALIAAYSDVDCTYGKILWSWHIWCTDQPVEHTYNNGAGIMMDRNLGATSAGINNVGSIGLFYQWGRKDPFLGGSSFSYASIYNQDKALSTFDWPSPEEANNHLSDNTTLAYSQSHPSTFLYSTNTPDDWYCSSQAYQNDALWGAEKTIYDPCPAGWHVPASCYELSDINSNGIWADAFNNGERSFQISISTRQYGYNYGINSLLGQYSTIWYPATGMLFGKNSPEKQPGGSLCFTGDRADYWAFTYSSFYPNTHNSHVLYFFVDGLYNKVNIDLYYSCRSNGHSVRCEKI